MAFSALEKVGIISLAFFGCFVVNKFLHFIYRNYLSPRARKINFKQLGQWALVTGSTDGVGKAYAKALAKKGCDVILVSRTEAKLQAVAAEIESEYHVKTKIIVADFTETEGIYDHIEKQLTGLEIGVLVNNVGVSYPYPEYFLNVPDKEVLFEQIIKANVVAVTRMCALVMPGMVERKRGLVINVSSAAAIMPAPLFAVYSASKKIIEAIVVVMTRMCALVMPGMVEKKRGLVVNVSSAIMLAPLFAVYTASKIYVDKLSQDLATVYERHGLIVQSVLPGPVATKMSKIHRATWMAPTPDVYVASALAKCGRGRTTTGYLPHDLLVGAISGLGALCPPAAEWLVTKTTENIRRRALRKAKEADAPPS